MNSIQSNSTLQTVVEQQLSAIEQKVDEEIDRLNNLEEDDLEVIRRKRLEEMRKIQQQKKDWELAGHGEYTEIPDEREFFNICKRSQRVVCHFYCDSFFRCKIADKHLSLLAPKHKETKFCKINAEKSPFLTKRLNIRVLPTIALILDGITIDYIRGFDDLGGNDEFTTDVLEARLAKSSLVTGVESVKTTTTKPKPIAIIREGSGVQTNKEDSDDDW